MDRIHDVHQSSRGSSTGRGRRSTNVLTNTRGFGHFWCAIPEMKKAAFLSGKAAFWRVDRGGIEPPTPGFSVRQKPPTQHGHNTEKVSFGAVNPSIQWSACTASVCGLRSILLTF